MTRTEWLEIGYDKGIIDLEVYEEVVFRQVFQKWFLMKLKAIKEQSCDRIEVTYNRYYLGTEFTEKCISKIADQDITDFLTTCILSHGDMTYKEFCRCLQIVNNVLVYAKDLRIGGAHLYDWSLIKRHLPLNKLASDHKKEFAIPRIDVVTLIDSVVNKRIYAEKQSASLCLCMNFYLGLRIGELAGLTFSDFDFERNIVKIYKTESKFYDRSEDGSRIGTMQYRIVEDVKTLYSVREIPMLPEVRYFYGLIKAHHTHCGYKSPYLAYDGRDTIMVRSLDRTLRRLCNLCGITYFNSHGIRKTFASMLHNGGVPTRVISDLMGHSEISTTEHNYILPFLDNGKEILNYMKGALGYGKITVTENTD